MTQVLQYSFNTGVVQVLKWLGGDETQCRGQTKVLRISYKPLFFGKRTGVQLAGEVSGEIVSPKDELGGDVRYANMSFGQGMTGNMLQVLSAFGAAVNGGMYFMPKIVDGTMADDGKTFAPTSDTIKKADVLTPTASASVTPDAARCSRRQQQWRQAKKAGYYIGGKTGTAQVYDPETGNYSVTMTQLEAILDSVGRRRPQSMS